MIPLSCSNTNNYNYNRTREGHSTSTNQRYSTLKNMENRSGYNDLNTSELELRKDNTEIIEREETPEILTDFRYNNPTKRNNIEEINSNILGTNLEYSKQNITNKGSKNNNHYSKINNDQDILANYLINNHDDVEYNSIKNESNNKKAFKASPNTDLNENLNLSNNRKNAFEGGIISTNQEIQRSNKKIKDTLLEGNKSGKSEVGRICMNNNNDVEENRYQDEVLMKNDPSETNFIPFNNNKKQKIFKNKNKNKKNVYENENKNESNEETFTEADNNILPITNQNLKKNNFEEIQIKSNIKSFEQLVEEKIIYNQSSPGGVPMQKRSPNKKDLSDKKPFLKRKDRAIKIPSENKKYKYYKSNFKDFKDNENENDKKKSNSPKKSKKIQKESPKKSSMLEREKNKKNSKIQKEEPVKIFAPKRNATIESSTSVNPDRKNSQHELTTKNKKITKNPKVEKPQKIIPKNKEDLPIVNHNNYVENVEEQPNEIVTKVKEIKKVVHSPKVRDFKGENKSNIKKESISNIRVEEKSEISEKGPSKLVKQMFYKEEDKQIKMKKMEDERKKIEEVKEFDNAIESKIEELNREIEKYKNENIRYSKQLLDFEKSKKKLNQERVEFEEAKKKMQEDFIIMKENETQKIEKEKRIIERQAKALQNVPNRKEREEMDQLKKEMTKLQEEIKIRDNKYKSSIERLKKQVEDLTIKNQELIEEIQGLEELKKNNWSKEVPNNLNLVFENNSENPSTQKNVIEENEDDNENEIETEILNENENESKSKTSAKNIGEQNSNIHDDDDNDIQAANIFELEKNQDSPINHSEKKEIIHKKEEKTIQNVNSNSKDTYDKNEEKDNSKILESDLSFEEKKSIHQKSKIKMKIEKNQNENGNVRDTSEGITKAGKIIEITNQKELIEEENEIDCHEGMKSQKIQKIEKESSEEDKETKDEKSYGDSEAEDFNLILPDKYHKIKNDRIISQKSYNNGQIHKLYESGKREIIFEDKVRKEMFPDGYTVIYFINNDIKQTFPEGKIVYFFAKVKTVQTTLPNGDIIYKFSNNQIEKHFKDKTKEVCFPDGTLKCIFPNGDEESIFPNGTIQKIYVNGLKETEYPEGIKEIEQPDGIKIKEFPDGRIRKTFPDGRYENTFKEIE